MVFALSLVGIGRWRALIQPIFELMERVRKGATLKKWRGPWRIRLRPIPARTPERMEQPFLEGLSRFPVRVRCRELNVINAREVVKHNLDELALYRLWEIFRFLFLGQWRVVGISSMPSLCILDNKVVRLRPNRTPAMRSSDDRAGFLQSL